MLNTVFSPWPSFTMEEADAVKNVLLSNKVNYWTGNEGRQFEEEFANWSQCKYAIALANGTVALDVALKVLGVGTGDEVIVTSRTFLASASSIITSGARPVFVDVDRDSQNVTRESIAQAITTKTKAIICVHLAGWPCEMDEILSLANEHDLFVIEDCAQAHGAKYKGRSVGSMGHISAWSFCQDKIMSTGGEGGMVTTNNYDYWSEMWSYKDHGKSWDAVYKKDHPPGFRWLHDSFGTNWRITEMQSVIGRIQLQRMPEWHRKRLENARAIWDSASELKGLRVPQLSNDIEHAAYKCYIFVEQGELKKGWNRDRIMEEVNKRGVPCFSGSCSEVYLEKAFDETGLRPSKPLPVAEELGRTSLMFMVHPTLTEEEVSLTCKVIADVMRLAV